MRREDLKKALLGMTPAQIAELVQEALEEQQIEGERQRAARSDDPLGTIRFMDGFAGHDVMWVRIAGHRWDPFLRDTHGNSMADHELGWVEYPIVGTMPQSWVEEQQRYEEDYE